MSKAYFATGEYAYLVCANGKTAGKALRKIGKFVDSIDDDIIVQSVNIEHDFDEKIVYVNATVTVLAK